jgi:hypothetical protein
MFPRIKNVKAIDNYKLIITFDNDEKRIFDVNPYLDKGFFKELNDISYFKTVRPYLNSIQWKNGQDFCPDTLYVESKAI